MLKIKKADFIISAVHREQYPSEGLPELALVGRSNVGKSSLINRLINRKNLARTSSQPGKTQTVNFYLINDAWFFVDLPGYGYARVSHTERENWRVMIEKYLTGRQELQEIWQLVDIRHPPSEQDRQMYEWLAHYGFPRLVIATKGDKISRGQRAKHLALIRRELGLSLAEPVYFSAETGEGRDELLERLEKRLDITARNAAAETGAGLET